MRYFLVLIFALFSVQVFADDSDAPKSCDQACFDKSNEKFPNNSVKGYAAFVSCKVLCSDRAMKSFNEEKKNRKLANEDEEE